MLYDQVIGDVVLKNIDQAQGCCTMEIHLMNDSYKNMGYGTEAEIQVLEFAFGKAEMLVVYADALIRNTRSQHIPKK